LQFFISQRRSVAADYTIAWGRGWRGDGSTRWRRLAGEVLRGQFYAGGKISACCLI